MAAITGLDRDSLDMVLGTIRDYAAAHLPESRLLALDQSHDFPVEVVRGMCGPELGVQLLFLPERFGGMGGGAMDVYRTSETLARIDLGVATGVLATFLGSDPLVYGGTPAQQDYWLSRLASEGLLMAYAATEAEAGSDLAALRSTAERVERDGAVVGYRLRGSKQWISNGGFADLYSYLANAPGGPSWFIVERDAAGLSHGQPEDKHGIRSSNTATVTLEDVYVEADRLVGGVEGQGLVQAQAVFGVTRLMVAAFGLGAGWETMDRAMRYSTTRIQAGTPLSDKQGYTHKLIVPHVVRLEAARAYIESIAERLDSGETGLNAEGAIAKYLATEFANSAADAAIQALGGYGYTREYMVEKIRRDVRITTIYEGTSEIMEMTISRERWQQHLKTRGQHDHEAGRALESLEKTHPTCGAAIAALAHHALGEVLEAARLARLTRHQHVLLRLGELVAWAEGAAALCRRATRARSGTLPNKSDARFAPEVVAAMARVMARDAALKIATDGLRLVHGAGGHADALSLTPIVQAQQGSLSDLDAVADACYGRVPTTA